MNTTETKPTYYRGQSLLLLRGKSKIEVSLVETYDHFPAVRVLCGSEQWLVKPEELTTKEEFLRKHLADLAQKFEETNGPLISRLNAGDNVDEIADSWNCARIGVISKTAKAIRLGLCPGPLEKYLRRQAHV